jgi:hypothetical protein
MSEANPAQQITKSPAEPRFRRGYVACTACRARKVRCIIDQQPPCAKCAREHRECRFNTTHTTRKHRDPPRWARHQDSESNSLRLDLNLAATDVIDQPTTDCISPQSGTRVGGSSSTQTGRESAASPRPLLADELGVGINQDTNNALQCLFDEAVAVSSETVLLADPSNTPECARSSSTNPSIETRRESTAQYGAFVHRLTEAEVSTYDLWDKCRFVRQGWFTAQEAITYVDLYLISYGNFCQLTIEADFSLGFMNTLSTQLGPQPIT